MLVKLMKIPKTYCGGGVKVTPSYAILLYIKLEFWKSRMGRKMLFNVMRSFHPRRISTFFFALLIGMWSFVVKLFRRVFAKLEISKEAKIKPISVNYHFTRKCNYQCGFCFHTAKTSFMLGLEDAKRGLQLLKDAGMEKINFSGGEPFLPQRGRFVGKLVQYCKQDLNINSVSVVSNGSYIEEWWFQQYGEFLDILAVSCDSFVEETNRAIGRFQGKQDHIEKLIQIRNWCNIYKVAFKINSVVNTYNVDENMIEQISNLNPVRWKVFQCLLLEGENAGPDALRNAEKFYITEEQFQEFIDRHKGVACLVPENNTKMRDSYLILDEYMRFLDCREGSKKPSLSILDVGVENALNHSGFDEDMFLKRGGVYEWSKGNMNLDW